MRALLFAALCAALRAWAPSLEPAGLPAVLRLAGASINGTLFGYAEPVCGDGPPAPAAGFRPAGALLTERKGSPSQSLSVLHSRLRVNVSTAAGEIVLLADFSVNTPQPGMSLGNGMFIALHNDDDGMNARGGGGNCLAYTSGDGPQQPGIYGCTGCSRIRHSASFALDALAGALALGADGAFIKNELSSTLRRTLTNLAPTTLTLRLSIAAGGVLAAAGLYDTAGLELADKEIAASLPQPLEALVGGPLARLAMGASSGAGDTSAFAVSALAVFSRAPPPNISAFSASASATPSAAPSSAIAPAQPGRLVGPLFGAAAAAAAAILASAAAAAVRLRSSGALSLCGCAPRAGAGRSATREAELLPWPPLLRKGGTPSYGTAA